MIDSLNRFYRSIPDGKRTPKELIGLFGYFLISEMGNESFSATDINRCFSVCDLSVPTRTAAYLSEGLDKHFVKVSRGYKLHRTYREEIATKFGASVEVVQVSKELRRLESKFAPGSKKTFLSETLDCFEAGANRATIVMCWILALDHLIDYVMAHHLAAFNVVLGKNNDKRIRITTIVKRDDFGEIPEGKLIEFLRAANIISNDVRKIMEEKLGTRNSSAHPSGISIKPSKVLDFVDDLLENVIFKYPI